MEPEILASMTDMGEIGEYEALFCCHALEHLYPHEVQIALREFYRVLKSDGAAVIFVPDLEDVRPTEEVLMVSPAGPIAGLDMFFGHRPQLAGRPHMAHHTGFVSETLEAALTEAGFSRVTIKRCHNYNLMGVGQK